MHYKFRARLQGQQDTIQMLVTKDMSVAELMDALSYALQINSQHQVVGFRDPINGLIIPPSVICSDPE